MLWGAFNNASSAMMAMSWDMGSISQNIANVNTTGYKRKETLFQTVMSESHAAPSTHSGRLNIFGVQTADRYHISTQGVITNSDFTNDLALNGKGFMMVAPPGAATGGAGGAQPPAAASVDDPASVLYTRDGSFSYVSGANGESYFTLGGNYLLGWMADEAGVVQPGGSLEAVYTLPTTTLEGKATTEASLALNIPSQAEQTPTQHKTYFTYTDPLGANQSMTVTWDRVDGNTWTVTPSVDAAVGTVTTTPITVTMDGWRTITDPAVTTQAIDIDWDDGAYGAATASSSTNIDISVDRPSPHLEKVFMSVFDDAFTEHSATLAFERYGSNTWYLHVNGGTNQTTGTMPDPVALEFSSEGQLLTPADLIQVGLSWTASGVDNTADFTLDLRNMTQFDNELLWSSIDQDGYGEGTMLNAGFNERGEMIGHFTNGENRVLFQVPIAQFVSENRLDPITGNLFRRTREAGDIRVGAVETMVGQPRFVPSSLETSTVDIEDEFTKMIVTQKAYSTNATVFRTADEMTVTARDLKA
ncbi:flagellar hook-basal body complex protein [Magnetospirillum sp. UT-4]|uniref:flagellar hook-basal body complex protein n=1 Tax=Magnetospirillum sp. UT-4 TaxID=2681467 RepID=UPI001380EBB4|nr:flagellar hook-basal body complex protein [Magnetospirillum sp. UT-4]CAA7615235.1 conserved hypothetical protein [Magnetospirillum sp. UT-4]